MHAIEKFHNWHQTTVGLVISALVEGLIAYFFASKAIDTGSWWQYFFTFIFAVGALQNVIKAISKHGGK